MAKGIVDVNVWAEMENDRIILVLDCAGGWPNDLRLIPDRESITVKRGNVSSQITMVQEQGNECAFNYLEMSAETARTFGLQHGDRVQLTYNEETKTLQMQRLNSSSAQATLLLDSRRNKDEVITIGYVLLSWLGIPDHAVGSTITLSRGTVNKKLKVVVPENELDEVFRMSASNIKAMGLTPRKKWKLTYDQDKRTLNISSNASSTTAGSSRKSKRSASTVRSAQSARLQHYKPAKTAKNKARKH